MEKNAGKFILLVINDAETDFFFGGFLEEMAINYWFSVVFLGGPF
jgi:hypothetical protein